MDDLLRRERENGGVLKIDTETVITPTSFGPGYLDRENEIIVGLQTDEPLKRACNPFGGMRMVRDACKAYGYERFRQRSRTNSATTRTHNDGVFSAYTPEIRAARHCGLITGLPDAYGRGRIIGDYRRVALYGVDRLIEEKKKDKLARGEEADGLSDTIRAPGGALRCRSRRSEDMKKMAAAVRLRHLPPGGKRPRGGAVDLLRLPRPPSRSRTARP